MVKRYALTDYRGKAVLVNLWATWCPPCRAEMPTIEKVYQEYQDQGLIVLGVNTTDQDDPTAIAPFVKQYGITFPILLDINGEAASFTNCVLCQHPSSLGAMASSRRSWSVDHVRGVDSHEHRRNHQMNILSLFQNIFAPPRDLILIILAAWIGLTLSEQRAPRHHVNLDSLSNLLLVSMIGFIVGGRMLYSLENLPIFAQSLASIFSLNIALFDQWGGLAIAAIAAFAYGQRVHLPLWHSLDVLTPLFATLAIGIAFSHLASGAAFGKETNVPWAIDQWGASRHPTQIYEIIASILTLALILDSETNSQAWIRISVICCIDIRKPPRHRGLSRR